MPRCNGTGRDEEQGYPKPCPLRNDCALHAEFRRRPKGFKALPVAPYDFDEDRCSEFVPND